MSWHSASTSARVANLPRTNDQANSTRVGTRPQAGLKTYAVDPLLHRDEVIDFVKGSLVAIMILYHWINYYIGLDWGGYRYLRFLTPSFILITGFLVSHFYLRRYSHDSPQLRARLVRRGLKLLGLFCVLNIAAEALIPGSARIGRPSDSWPVKLYDIFITGDGRAAFVILVPISYFLMLAPFILLIAKRIHVSLGAVASFWLAAVIVANLWGVTNPYIEFLAIALVGAAVGAMNSGAIETRATRPVWLVGGYLLYLAGITFWDVPFWLQVIGVCLNLLIFYVVGARWGTRGFGQRLIVKLGQYSLFAYVVQIAVLQVLRRASRSVDWTGFELLIPLVATAAATIMAVELVSVARLRSSAIDSWYRAVFA